MMRRIIRKIYRFFQYLPFINRIKLRTAVLKTGRNSILLKSRIQCAGKNNMIIVGDDCLLRRIHIYIHGDNNLIVVGNHVLATEAEFWIEDNNNSISVGNDSKFMGRIHIACIEGQTVSIGKDCLFSSDIVIRTGDSHSIIDFSGRRINNSAPVSIGNHVWVGNRAILLKGVKIGNNCVIGTGAIVTKSFSEGNAIIAGVPARITKSRIDWDINRKCEL